MNMQNDILVVDGFDVVGKTTFIEKVSKDLGYAAFSNFGASMGITSLKGEYGVGFENSWIVGASIARLASMTTVGKLVIDRGILSTIVYGELKDGKSLAEGYLARYASDMVGAGMSVTYLRHKNIESAKFKYQKSREEREELFDPDGYDAWKTFGEYWSEYLEYDEKFMHAVGRVQKLGVKVEVVEVGAE